VWRPRAHTESSGHGMEIMRALSDHVHIHRTPQGTTVVMEAKVAQPLKPPDRAATLPATRGG
jgi:anti-sigma regulatory factor (Ser/Thr protein kinase)